MPLEEQAAFGRKLLAILQATDPEDIDPVTEFMIAAVQARIDHLQPKDDPISGVHRHRWARPKMKLEFLPATLAKLDKIFDQYIVKGALERAVVGILLEANRPMKLEELCRRTGYAPSTIVDVPSYPRVRAALAEHNLVLRGSAKRSWSLSARFPAQE